MNDTVTTPATPAGGSAPPELVAIPSGKRNLIPKKLRHRIRKIKLGEADLQKCKISKPKKTAGAIYVPTTGGGELALSIPKRRRAKLFYINGRLPTKRKISRLIRRLKSGYHQNHEVEYLNYYETPNGKRHVHFWKIAPNTMGWFFFTVTGKKAVLVKNEFFQVFSLSREPWYGYWWSYLEDSHRRIPTNLRMWLVNGPLDKYDDFVGNRWPPMRNRAKSARAWEYDNHRKTGDPKYWWWGHCPGVAVSGFEVKLPTLPSKKLKGKKGNDVTFLISHLQGIGAERWLFSTDKTNYIFYYRWDAYRKDEDYTPKNFYRLIRKFLSSSSTHGFVMDVYDGPDEVWCHPVFKCKANFIADGPSGEEKRSITINAELTFKETVDTISDRMSKIKLKFDENGEIEGKGRWLPEGFRSKQIFYPKSDVQPVNQRLEIKAADEILR